MKYLFLFALLLSVDAYADNCKVTTVVVENNGKVDTETATVCRDGSVVQPKIRVGDVILENEVSRNPKVNDYFSYKNSHCRMFTEHTAKNNQMHVYHGVICQLDGSDTNWLVVDKW
jgi:hypothetical protein